MLKIEIETAEISERKGVSAKSGKPYCMREQKAAAFLPGSKYPVQIKITLGDEQEPYVPGFYTLLPESFFAGRFGELMCRPVLARLQAAQPKAA